jgi:hypothetical protein
MSDFPISVVSVMQFHLLHTGETRMNATDTASVDEVDALSGMCRGTSLLADVHQRRP